MGRPRAFDTETAVARALDTFWSRGYEATSVGDLCGAMGLSRSSLYEAFGSKHGLLLAALESYEAGVTKRVAAALSRPFPVQVNLRDFLMVFVDGAVEGPGRRGCFLGNCTGELAAAEPELAARFGSAFDAIEGEIHVALARGQAAGEIAPDTDIRALARFLVSTIQGLRLVAKANPHRDRLVDIVDVALRTVR
ncbi:MAG: TetR/AcrR family transcriptional regulator [Alphaproteobacteria bacterium]